jgi:putative transposase
MRVHEAQITRRQFQRRRIAVLAVVEQRDHERARRVVRRVEVLRQAKETLDLHLPLEADGYTVTSETLYDILLGIAANRGTTESICAELAEAPNPETIRRYFNEQFTVEQLPELQRRINSGLAAHWPKKLRRDGPIEAAIDFHDRPYVEVVRDLRQMLRQRGLHISLLYLDKGFSGVPVLRYLHRCQQASLIACPIRGKQGGTRALCQGRKSYRTAYTFNQGKDEEFTAQLVVCRVFTTSRRTKPGKRRGEWLLFVAVCLDWPPEKCRQRYRKRFGIETSYRLANKSLGWTTSPNAAYRFVLMGLGFILLNHWVHLCWLYTQVARRGGRAFNVKLFRQTRFLNFVKHALERLYGTVNEVTAPAPARL